MSSPALARALTAGEQSPEVVAEYKIVVRSPSAATVLARMLDAYERGAKFEQPDAKDVLLHVSEEEFPDAFGPNGRERHEALLADVNLLEHAGAVRVVRRRLRGGGERVELRLGPAEVQRAYEVAADHGYVPLRTLLDALAANVRRLGADDAADQDVDDDVDDDDVDDLQAPEWWRSYLDQVHEAVRGGDLRLLGIASRIRLKSEWADVRDALIAADRLARRVDAWARHLSEALFADSKRLTQIKARVASLLRSADPHWEGAELSDPEDVLSAYGIRRRPPTITCAGAIPLPVGIAGEQHEQHERGGVRLYDLGDFEPVAVLPARWGSAIVAGALASGVRVVTTIENEYPFLSYVEEAGGPAGLGARGELVLWSSGFVADHLLDLLEEIARRAGDQVAFQHWGDADPAGLAIWWQIRSRLGQPVALLRTTAAWVEQVAIREGQPLSDAERRLLTAQIARFRPPAATAEAAGGCPGVPPATVDDLTEATALAETLLRLGAKIEQERL